MNEKKNCKKKKKKTIKLKLRKHNENIKSSQDFIFQVLVLN